MSEKIINAPAHGSNVARADIPAAYKWHTEDIYEEEAIWEKECEAFKAQIPTIKALQGQLTTAAKLLEALKLQDSMAMQLDKLYAYAALQKDADGSNQHLQGLVGTAANLAALFSSSNSFIEPEMLALGKEKLDAMLEEEPALQEYAFYIENFLRLNEHILSADKEALFAKGHLAT